MLRSLRRARARLDALLLEGAFQSLARLGRLHPRARPEKHGVELIRDVAYRDTQLAEHRLDVYRPIARSGPLPVVLYVHGGGFCMLSKETHWIMALAFARRGFVVFNVNYRLAPANKFPAGIEDVCSAFAWVAKNAAELGGDPERVVLAGESAGANLVTSLALATSYARPEPWVRAAFDAPARPRVVLPACGILQVTDCARFARRRPYPRWLTLQVERVERAYLGGVERGHERAFDLADPLVALERGDAPDRPLPSFHVVSGTRDLLLDDSRRLAGALERLGARCELVVYPGEVHAFHAFVWRATARDYWNKAHAFIGEQLASPAAIR